jgi:hypothetical protein
MAITNTQQARQMYNEGGKKPVTQAGVKNFLGKQEMVTAPKFWLSEPDHVKAKLAYITDEEEKILIDKNLYGSLKGKPNKGPAGLPSLQGGDAGGLGSSGSAAGDSDGPTGRDRAMGLQGKTGRTDKSLDVGGPGVDRSKVSQFSQFGRNVMAKNLQSLQPNLAQRAFDLYKKFSPLGIVTSALGKFGPKSFTDKFGYATDYQGTTGPSSVDDDDDTRGGDGMPLYAQLGYPSQQAYMAAMGLTRPSAGLPAAVQPMQTMDLNRIAYRFMADGGFLDDEIDERQAYGLGSIVRKITRPIKKVVKKATRAVKKVAKSPIGRLAIAVAAPYALGPAMANAQFLAGLSAAQKAAIISGATTGITQLASGEGLDFKDIAVSAALGGASAKMFPGNIPGKAQATPFERQAFSAAQTQGLGSTGLDPSTLASRARVASDIAPKNTSFLRDSFMGSRGKGIADVVSTTTKDPSIFTRITEGLGNIKDSKVTDMLLRNKETGKLSPLKIASLAGLAGLATAKGVGEEEELQEMDRGEGIDIAAIRRRPFDYLAPRFAGSEFNFYAAEGGQAKKEPVAKKVMPLLDMGGMEKDYRAEGGFVPIGRMEKADDVPARLSKNEFVFTADAVRNAGDGDVDKGAEVMYNMMKNLEAGGDVSEESQGLEGARRMFQTSQRLEEVL